MMLASHSGLLVIVMLLGSAPGASAGLRLDRTNVSKTVTDSLTPVAASSGAMVHVAWIESEATTDGLRATILYARSTDQGATFEPSKAIAPLVGYASGLQCIADGSVVHVAWLATSYTTGSPAAVDYVRSADDGLTFSEYASVSGDVPPGVPSITARGGSMAIAWSASGRIWTCRSRDGGASVSGPAPIQLPSEAPRSAVRLACTDSALLAAWSGGDTRILRIGRVDWASGDFEPVAGPNAEAVTDVVVAASGSGVVVAWTRDSRPLAAFASVSDDGGATFAESRPCGSSSTQTAPRAGISDGEATIVWIADPASIVILRFRSDGSNVMVPVRGNRRATSLDIRVDGTGLVACWRNGDTREGVVRAAVWPAAGGSTKVATVSRRGRSAVAPRVTAGPASAVVVWQQRDGPTAEVYAGQIPR